MTHPPAPAPLPPEEIERIDRLYQAATAGPWHYDRTTISAYVWPEKGSWICNLVIPADCWHSETIEDNPGSRDARSIVALHNAWPSIKAEIEAGRAGAERVRALEDVAKVADAMEDDAPSHPFDNGATADGWVRACRKLAERARSMKSEGPVNE